ncbi:MAG: N-acetylmuramoyl-L-alanine amidase [Hyphomicrobiaceae bacterium]|nr:N-acetylmuramoyl-L-alanine amidase [Hyphomicrobiaceae bacterium]
MNLEVRDRKLFGVGVQHKPSPNFGCRIEPSLIVLHDTAGALRQGSSVEWFLSPECKTSAHIVIERNGSVVQMVDFDVKAFHAGESAWKGRKYCNGYSIGIEMVGPGKLTAPKSGVCKADGFKLELASIAEAPIEASSPACGSGYWLPYTEAQLQSLDAVVRAILNAYPAIAEIVGHHDISPGRKIDPCPLMPWSRVRAALGARKADDPEAIADVQRRLQSLGYQLGAPDGHWGPRTRSAIRDFQDQNNLSITGTVDEATNAVLMSDQAKAMPAGSRDEWTAKDLVKQGSSQVSLGLKAQTAGKIVTAASTALIAGSSVDDVSEVAQAAVGQAETAIAIGERVSTLGSKFGPLALKLAASPTVQLAGAVIVIGVLCWLFGGKVVAARLRAAKQGQHVGV